MPPPGLIESQQSTGYPGVTIESRDSTGYNQHQADYLPRPTREHFYQPMPTHVMRKGALDGLQPCPDSGRPNRQRCPGHGVAQYRRPAIRGGRAPQHSGPATAQRDGKYVPRRGWRLHRRCSEVAGHASTRGCLGVYNGKPGRRAKGEKTGRKRSKGATGHSRPAQLGHNCEHKTQQAQTSWQTRDCPCT